MDFDRIFDRRNTGSLKWDPGKSGVEDIVPLWVADMDFASPEGVIQALRARLEHPIFGYTSPGPEYFRSLAGWYSTRYGAELDPESFLLGPGTVPSLGIAVRTFAEPGEGVLIMPPVYYPFRELVRTNGRVVVEAPLVRDKTFRYRMDFDRARAEVAEHERKGVKTRLILFCSPQNPGGTVWRRDELSELIRFAGDYGLFIVSDEIHGDIVFPPNTFVSVAGFRDVSERTVVVSAPNKTFNLAGLHISHFVARDEAVRSRLRKGIAAAGFSQPNLFSLAAAEAAYRTGSGWLEELIAYLRSNIDFTVAFLTDNVPAIETAPPEGTYMVWADAVKLIRERGLRDDQDLVSRLETEAKVRFTAGSVFGTGGRGFIRINAASPRPILAEGLNRLSDWSRKAG